MKSFLGRSDRGGLAVVALVSALAWVYLIWMAWGMEHMDAGLILMPRMTDWTAADLVLIGLMWSVMMVGMMLPAAAPMLLAFGAVNSRVDPVRPSSHLVAFAAGYLLIWTSFSIVAALLQWGLLRWRLVSPMMVSASAWLSGGLLCLAGVYQFTRWKAACLRLCQAPMAFLVKHWRTGWWGALVLGLLHGAFCLGCCWALMALLFVLGVMNLWWIAALSLFVMAEKAFPAARWLPRVAGAGLCGWGLWLIGRAAFALA